MEISKSIKDVILDEPKKSGEPTEPVIYEPEDKSHLTKWDKCKIWCCNAYHPYKKLPMLKWIQVTLSIKVMQLIQNDDSSLMSHLPSGCFIMFFFISFFTSFSFTWFKIFFVIVNFQVFIFGFISLKMMFWMDIYGFWLPWPSCLYFKVIWVGKSLVEICLDNFPKSVSPFMPPPRAGSHVGRAAVVIF